MKKVTPNKKLPTNTLALEHYVMFSCISKKRNYSKHIFKSCRDQAVNTLSILTRGFIFESKV